MRSPLQCGPVVAGLVLAVTSWMTPTHASAAIMDFTNFTEFQNAATGVQQILDFETLTTGLDISNIPGVVVEELGAAGLAAVETTLGETLSETHFLGSSDPLGQELTEFDQIIIEFDEPRSAIGLWVQYDDSSGANDNEFFLEDLDNSANFALVDEADFTPLGNGRAYFIGLVDDEGIDSINGVTLFADSLNGDPINFTIDNVVSFQVAAVPEPGSIAFCVLACGGVAWRKRKRSASI